MLSLYFARSILILKRFPSSLNFTILSYQMCWCSTDVTQRKKNGGERCKRTAWLHSRLGFEHKKLSNSHLPLKQNSELINLRRQAQMKKTSQDSSLLTASKVADKPSKGHERGCCDVFLHFTPQLSRWRETEPVYCFWVIVTGMSVTGGCVQGHELVDGGVSLSAAAADVQGSDKKLRETYICC